MQRRITLGDSPHAAQYVMFAIYWDQIAVKWRRKHFTHQHRDIHVIHLPLFPRYCFGYERSYPKGGSNMVKKQPIFFFCSSVTTSSISLSLWEKCLKLLRKGSGKAKTRVEKSFPIFSPITHISDSCESRRRHTAGTVVSDYPLELHLSTQRCKRDKTRANTGKHCLCVHREVGTTGTNTSSRIVGAESGEHSRLKAEAGWAVFTSHPHSQTALTVQLIFLFFFVFFKRSIPCLINKSIY